MSFKVSSFAPDCSLEVTGIPWVGAGGRGALQAPREHTVPGWVPCCRYQSLGVISTVGASDRLWFRERFDHAASAVGNAWFPLFRLTSLSSLSSS